MAMGSHTGSFAGGFIKAFLAAMQMRMRMRQQEKMNEYIDMLIAQGRANMQNQTNARMWGEAGYERARLGLSGFSYGGGEGGKDPGTGATKAGMNYENADRVYKYLVDKGADPEAAKGFVGSMAHESAGFKNDALNPKDPDTPSGGWGQWHGPRYDDFVSRAGSDNTKWTADDNFNMFKHEMEDTPGGRETLDQLKHGKSIEDGVNISTRTYEGASLDPKTVGWESRFGFAHAFDNHVSGQAKTEPAKPEPVKTTEPVKPSEKAPGDIVSPSGGPYIFYHGNWYESDKDGGIVGKPVPLDKVPQELKDKTSSQAQPIKPYGVAGPDQPPPATAIPPRPDQFQTGGPELAAATAPVPPVTPAVPAAAAAPAPAPATSAPATVQPAPAQAIPDRGQLPPGLMQSDIPGVRGQQPGAPGPIYTAGSFGPTTQQGQPAPAGAPAPAGPATAATTGVTKYPIVAPPAQPGGQQKPTPPMPPKRPAELGALPDTGTLTGTGGGTASMNVAGAGSGDALFYGYAGGSPEQSASADPTDNMYSMAQMGAASAGLTDTSGLMTLGMMSRIADDNTDVTANMWRGGPVIRYRRGGVIQRYEDGGGVDPQIEPTTLPPMDPSDRDTLIRTVAGEAGGEPPIGQAAVAHVIMNRVNDGGYGAGIQGVAQAPAAGAPPGSGYHEFSTWNPPNKGGSAGARNIDNINYSKIGNIVDGVYNGSIPDPTNGATHYYAPRGMPGGRAPSWAVSLAKQNQVSIGNQIFVGRAQGPGQSAGYRKGGVIQRFAAGGAANDGDFLSEYGGTDTDDPMNQMYQLSRLQAGVTNNSDAGLGRPDLASSIQSGAQLTPQEQQQIQAPPAPQVTYPGATPPAQAAPAAPAAPAQPTDQPTPPTTTSQSDIPPGSVDVAGPGGWGRASLGSMTTFPAPRVGGMGMGFRSPRIGLGMGRSLGRATSIGAVGGNPLYIPHSIAEEDFDSKGLAPVNNSDGSPGAWLYNMVDNGLGAILKAFPIMGRGAIPTQDQSQGLAAFNDPNSPSIPTKEEMHGFKELYDPDDKMLDSMAEIGGAVSMIKYYSITGQLDLASRLAGGVLMYTRMMSMEYGDKAVNALFKGDLKNAVSFLEQAHGWVPDGRTSSGEVIDKDKGIVRAQLKDGNGNVLDQQDYMPAAIMEAALGARNGQSYWKFLSGLAGQNDPIGQHIQLQSRLRDIQGNQFVPPPPIADTIGKSIPIGGPQTTPTTPPSPDTAPATQPAPTTPSPTQTQTTPPIPDPNAGVGMATPPQAPATQGMPDRGQVPPNLVAGPGVSSQVQPGPPQPSSSGQVLVNREQQADPISAAVNRMMQSGGYDPNDPYLQQIYSQIEQRELGPYQQYRTSLEQQLAEVEGANVSPQDRNALKATIIQKIKAFDDAYMKPQVAKVNRELNEVAARAKEGFTMAMTAEKQKEAEKEKLVTAQRSEDAARVQGEQKRRAMLPDTNVDVRAQKGMAPGGGDLIGADGIRIPSYADQTARPLTDKVGDAYANPIARSILQGNPWLSSTYDGKDDKTVDMSKIGTYQGEGQHGKELFKPTDLRIADEASRDLVAANGGMIDYREANDLATGVSTGQYTIQRVPHEKIHSMVLGDIDEDDGIPRTDVLIGRGLNDPNPVRAVMPTDSANRLAGLAQKAQQVTIHNRAMAHARDPDITSLRDRPAYRTPIPQDVTRAPLSASNAPVNRPPQDAPISPRPRRLQDYPLPPIVPNEQIPPDWRSQFPELNR